jgi:hypothetical protein
MRKIGNVILNPPSSPRKWRPRKPTSRLKIDSSIVYQRGYRFRGNDQGCVKFGGPSDRNMPKLPFYRLGSYDCYRHLLFIAIA